jgi:hypothetical protein
MASFLGLAQADANLLNHSQRMASIATPSIAFLSDVNPANAGPAHMPRRIVSRQRAALHWCKRPAGVLLTEELSPVDAPFLYSVSVVEASASYWQIA